MAIGWGFAIADYWPQKSRMIVNFPTLTILSAEAVSALKLWMSILDEKLVILLKLREHMRASTIWNCYEYSQGPIWENSKVMLHKSFLLSFWVNALYFVVTCNVEEISNAQCLLIFPCRKELTSMEEIHCKKLGYKQLMNYCQLDDNKRRKSLKMC